MIEIPYLKEIPGLEWVREVISERFQNATEIMTPRSVIYGGAIRDAIAGIELVGDLDIAVPKQDKKDIVNRFLEDPRWRARKAANSPWARINAAGYDKPVRENIPMQDIIEFVTFKDAVSQIMVSNIPGKDPFLSAVGMAKQVDFRCCSMILTFDGRVFETIEGGLEDCQNRVLRINEESTTIHLDTVQSRIDKLTGRGWMSLVDVEATTERVKAQRAKEERDRIRKHSAIQNKHKKMFATSTDVGGSIEARKMRDELEIRKESTGNGYFIRVHPTLAKRISRDALGGIINEVVDNNFAGPEMISMVSPVKTKLVYHSMPGDSFILSCETSVPLIKVRELIIIHILKGWNAEHGRKMPEAYGYPAGKPTLKTYFKPRSNFAKSNF
jgi:hypothetical protein